MIKIKIYTNDNPQYYLIEILDEAHKVRINKNKSIEDIIKSLDLSEEEVEVI